jgi:hypothetical protein
MSRTSASGTLQRSAWTSGQRQVWAVRDFFLFVDTLGGKETLAATTNRSGPFDGTGHSILLVTKAHSSLHCRNGWFFDAVSLFSKAG